MGARGCRGGTPQDTERKGEGVHPAAASSPVAKHPSTSSLSPTLTPSASTKYDEPRALDVWTSQGKY